MFPDPVAQGPRADERGLKHSLSYFDHQETKVRQQDKGSCHRQGCSCWKARPETIVVDHLRGRFEMPVRLDPAHLLIVCQQPWMDSLQYPRHRAHKVRSAIARAGRSTSCPLQVVLLGEEGSGAHQEPSWR